MKTLDVRSLIPILVENCHLTVVFCHPNGQWEKAGTEAASSVKAVMATMEAIMERLIVHGGWGPIRDILIKDDRDRVWILKGLFEDGEDAILAVGPVGDDCPWTVGQVLQFLASTAEPRFEASHHPIDNQPWLGQGSPRDELRKFQSAILETIRMGDPLTLRILMEKSINRWPFGYHPGTLDQAITRMAAFIAVCEETAIRGGLDPLVAEEIGERYIAKVKRCKSFSEAPMVIVPMLHTLAEQVAQLPFRGMSGKCRQMIRYVVTNLDRSVPLSEAAAHVGLSTNYAGALIKREAGESFSIIVQKIRISRAQVLLRTTSLSIAEVSRRVGYPHANQFARTFRTFTAFSPRDFRYSHSGFVDLVPFSTDNSLTEELS